MYPSIKLFFHFLQFPLLTFLFHNTPHASSTSDSQLLPPFIPSARTYFLWPSSPSQMAATSSLVLPLPRLFLIGSCLSLLRSNTLLLWASLPLIPLGTVITLLQIQLSSPFYLGPPLLIFNHLTT